MNLLTQLFPAPSGCTCFTPYSRDPDPAPVTPQGSNSKGHDFEGTLFLREFLRDEKNDLRDSPTADGKREETSNIKVYRLDERRTVGCRCKEETPVSKIYSVKTDRV